MTYPVLGLGERPDTEPKPPHSTVISPLSLDLSNSDSGQGLGNRGARPHLKWLTLGTTLELVRNAGSQLHPRALESESAFSRDTQVNLMQFKFEKF